MSAAMRAEIACRTSYFRFQDFNVTVTNVAIGAEITGRAFMFVTCQVPVMNEAIQAESVCAPDVQRSCGHRGPSWQRCIALILHARRLRFALHLHSFEMSGLNRTVHLLKILH